MSIKDLFGKTSKSLEDTVQDVESVKFVEEKTKKQERYLPPVDFSDPKNFAFYGSAQLYYEAAIKRIYEDYPYDGSKAEQIEFEEKASHLERWMFESKYPRTTGYIELGTTGDLSGNGFKSTGTPEYIRVWGGLHTQETTRLEDKFNKSAKYDESKNRNQNWNCDFDEGVTLEFWMKKDAEMSAGSPEVILDLWNGKTGSDIGRVFLYTFRASTNVFFLRVESGTSLFESQIQSTDLDLLNWHHYAISMKQVDNQFQVRFYIDGIEDRLRTSSSTFSQIEGKIDGFIGAMQAPFGNYGEGDGKLSAKLDEFRFWKTCRTSRQIKLNWFSSVGGGANTDDATSDLGVYLKFNEGIVGNSLVDSVVLDYSGRLANGKWIGYPGSSARFTGSAIEARGYKETKTPIIYSDHPDVKALISEMSTSGSVYDADRGQSFFNSMPTWLQEEDNGNFRILSHILASYLDTLHVQIKEMTEIKNKQYRPEEFKANTLASELLKERGFLTPNLFESSEIHEKLSDLNLDDVQFDTDLSEIKNTIYTNIYNNLEKIYKSKGTEGSIRNLIRCFGVDDELIRLNLYTDGGVQYFTDKARETSVKKKFINFNNPNNFEASIYQTSSADNPNTFIYGSHTLIDGSRNAFTLEADIVVPYKKEVGESGHFATPFVSSSVFGFHEANEADASDYTWVSLPAVSATGEIDFENILFPSDWENRTITLTSTDGTVRTYEFTDASGVNGAVLGNGNINVDISPTEFWRTTRNFQDAVNSANGHAGKISAAWTTGSYIVSLSQVDPGAAGNTTIQYDFKDSIIIVTDFHDGADVREDMNLQVYLVKDSRGSRNAKFVLKNELETIYQESDWIYDIYENEHYNVAIRIKPQTYPYAGGVTNTTPDYDIELYAVTNNLGDIEEEVLLSEVVSYDVGSKYIRAPKRVYAGAHITNFTGSVAKESDIQIGGVRAWLDYLTNEEIFQHNKDPLNYGTSRSMDGANLYTIDGVQIPSRELTILNWDFDTVSTSDSNGEFDVEDITSGATDTIYGWIDDIIRREHKAKGSGFLSEDSSFLSNEFLFAKKKQLPEAAYDADNIYIKGEQEINFSDDDDVSDNLFILEKSPSALVSEEMLKSFSTTLEFANLFARPVERFRVEYKDLAHARDLFFQRVESDLDFDRFFEYFKWIDSSISSMVNQLIPLSANFAGGIVDVIEPHILERDKYQRQIGLLNTVTSTEASIKGRQELGYNWRIGHAPIPNVDDPSQYAFWQRERREREEAEREQLRQVAIRQTDQEYTNPINLSGSTGVVSGNTYATRRLSRTYEMGIDFRNSIHGGINYDKGKDRDFLKTVVTPHGEVGGSGAPVNIMTIGVGEGHGLIATGSWTDVNPNELVKLDGHAQVGKFSNLSNNESLDPEYDFYYRRKISDVFPGNIISSSVESGYASSINRSGDNQGYNYGTNVVNIHSDTTDITNEIPVQGPFTQQWVGGRQERHVDLATGSYDNSTRYLRPEAWRFLVGTNPLLHPSDNDGAIGFTGPDYGGGYPIYDQAKAIFYREERAKRPVNIKNIQTIIGTGSHGNYIRGYEVFSTFGDQGYYLRRADQLLPQEIAEALPETTNYHTLIAQTTSDSGNFFGEGNNRQYGYTIAGSPEIPPQQASDSTFSVYGLSQQTDGSELTIQNDAGDTWSYQTPTITGADSTEFYNNLETQIQNDLGSFFSVTYQEQNSSTSYPSLRVQFRTSKTNNTGLETNNSYDPSKYPNWNGGGANWAFSSFVTFNRLENDGNASVIYAENAGTSATSVDRVTVREIMINRNLDLLIFNHRYYDSSKVIRKDTYSMDYAGIINEGQSHHIIITQDDKIGYDTDANEPTVKVFVDGELRSWTQTPSTVYPTPHSAIDLKSVVLATNFIDESLTYSIGLAGEDAGASEMDESTVYNILVDSLIASEIYNNAAPWEATNPTLQFTHFNYATDVEARWTFSDSVNDFSDTRVLDDVTGNGNDLIVYEPNEGTYDKIRQGTGISYIDEQADFTISPYNVGAYGNLSLEISPSTGDNSFFDIVDGVGGVNFVPAVEDQFVGNIIDTQDRSTGSAHVIRSRFSAPGGPEVNSSGYLDVATQQYSVHNSINFRNLTLRGPSSGEDDRIRLDTHQVTVSEGRREGLKTLRARHQGKFGIESKYGEISDVGYDTNASYHKQHRNTRYVIKDLVVDDVVVDDKSPKYDNENYHSLLPASEFQYSWINQAVVSGSGQDWRDDQPILGFSPKNGMTIGSDGHVPAINFPGISDFDQSLCLIAQELRIPIVNLTAGEDPLSLSYTNNTVTVLPTIEDFAGTGMEMIPDNWSTLDLDYVFASCCTEDPEFRLNNGAWTTTVPTSEIPNGPIYYSPGSDIYLNYKIKDCLDNEGITEIRFQDASYTESYLSAKLLYRIGAENGGTVAVNTIMDQTLVVAKNLESRQVGEILPPHLSPDDEVAYFKFITETNISETQTIYHKYYGQFNDEQGTTYLEPSENFPYYHSPGLSLQVRYNPQVALLEDNLIITLEDAAYDEPSIDLNFEAVSGINAKGGYIYEIIPNPSFANIGYRFCIDEPSTTLVPASCEPYEQTGNFTIDDFNDRTTLFVVSENLNIGEPGSYTQFKYRLSDQAGYGDPVTWQSRWFTHDDPTQVPFINYNETPIEDATASFTRKIEIVYFDYDDQGDLGKFNTYAEILIWNVDMQRVETENASLELHWSWGAEGDNYESEAPTNRTDIVSGQFEYIEGYFNYSPTNLEDKDLADMHIRTNFSWGSVPDDFRENITSLEFRRINVAPDSTETVVTDWQEIHPLDEPKVFAPNEVFGYTATTGELFYRRIEFRVNGYSEEWHKDSFYTWVIVAVNNLEVTQSYIMSPI